MNNSVDQRVQLARAMMPKADEKSVEILAGSRLLEMMFRQSRSFPKNYKAEHADVTGIYQRKSGKRF